MKKVDPKLIPEINIGTLGHVDQGKSTLVQAISGRWPAVHSEELKRGITIKLGYADATIYKCKKCDGFSSTDKCMKCMEKCEPERTISFVDAPGHETLMATVLSGAALMDGVLFIISANEKCPRPQTREHLVVLDIVGIKNIIIVQTKIDLVSEERARESYEEIKNFVKGTIAENAPIVPISSQQKININFLLKTIEEKIPTPKRDDTKPPKAFIVRSFDVNKPGITPEKLSGGVLGGALVQGRLKVGDEIEITPGIKVKEKWKLITTKINGLQKAGKDLEEAGPGGLLGIMTNLDPYLTKSDSLSGNLVGKGLPQPQSKIEINVNLIESLFDGKLEPVKKGEILMLNMGVTRTIGSVVNIKKGKHELDLKLPIPAKKGERVVLSRRISDRWRLIGWGTIQ